MCQDNNTDQQHSKLYIRGDGQWDKVESIYCDIKTYKKTPYAIQALAEWVKQIELNNKIIDLDFTKILSNLQELIKDNNEEFVISMFVELDGEGGHGNSIFHYILGRRTFLFPPFKAESMIRFKTKLSKIINTDIHKYMIQCIKILKLFVTDTKLLDIDATIEHGSWTYTYSFYELVKDCLLNMYGYVEYYKKLDCADIMRKYLLFFMDLINDANINRNSTIPKGTWHDMMEQSALITLNDDIVIIHIIKRNKDIR